MKREITVTVLGRSGHGKTSLANLIANALLNAGITVIKPRELDGDDQQTGEQVAEAVNHLNAHGLEVTVLTQHVRVTPPAPDTEAVALLREIYNDVVQGAIPNRDDNWWARTRKVLGVTK